MSLKTIVLTLCFLATCASSARILGMFPLPAKSHHIIASTLMKELALRGHEVTMISTFPLKNPPKTYKDIDVSEIMPAKEKIMEVMMNPETSYLGQAINAYNIMNLFTTGFLDTKEFKNFMKKGEKFDVVIQMVLLNEATLGVSHLVNATSVISLGVTSLFPFWQYIHMNPMPYSYVPATVTSFGDEMVFWQRLVNTIGGFGSEMIVPLINWQYQKSLKDKYFPNTPPLSELVEKIDLQLVNSHVSTETPRPYLPNTIQIGGFVLANKEKLSDDVQSFLDNSKNGVIYFSFGSNYNTTMMPKNVVHALIESFKATPFEVLWKYDGDLDGLPAKIMTKKWLQQSAILAHPNIKAFITHAGMGGTAEAIFNGVPMIAIPMYGDQTKNAAQIVKDGFGVQLKFEEITKDKLVKAIEKVTMDKSFVETIKLRSDIYKNQEMNPLDKAVFWVEHVIKHKGAKHLKAKAGQLYWFQYMLLDVLSFIALTLGLAMFVTYKIGKKVLRFCFCRSKKVDARKKQQ